MSGPRDGGLDATDDRPQARLVETATTSPFELYFDGDCPLCRREIDMMRRLDTRGAVRFVDIAADPLPPDAPAFDTLMAKIHGRTADGVWVTGVEVFRLAYGALGFERLAAWSRFKPVDAALRAGYEVFARNRLRWTGRCEEGTCRTTT